MKEDGAYCKWCIAFGDSSARGRPEFTIKPFRDWKNATGSKRGALQQHALGLNHRTAAEKAEEFRLLCIGKRKSICSTLSKAYNEKIEQNRKGLISIIDVILMLGMRGMALRGDWDKVEHKENSNFNFFVKWKSKFDGDLKCHLESAPKNAVYLSPKIQNEFIECIEHIIRDDIVARANNSAFLSVIADETTDVSISQQLSICIRFLENIDGKFEVIEDFLGFTALEKADAETISKAILEDLQSWGIDVHKIRGQGYDGCSTMSGHVTGVQTRIKTAFPKAKYFTHCANHRLNLVIVASCQSVPDIRNFMNKFQNISFFLCNSGKRKAILKRHVKNSTQLSEILLNDADDDTTADEEELCRGIKRSGIPTLCDTRWLSRGDSISALIANFEQVLEALEEIMNSSGGQSSSDADSHILAIRQFKFIYSAVISQYILAFIRPLSIALQAKSCDLLACHHEAQDLIRTIANFRDENDIHDKLYERSVSLAAQIGVDPTSPRTTGKQQHRSNAGNGQEMTICHYYKVS